MNLAKYTSIIVVLFWTRVTTSGQATPASDDVDCQQCNAQCPTRPIESQSRVIIGQRGPPGPRGEWGSPGNKGYTGDRRYRGSKGDRGPNGVVNMTAIELLIDQRIQQGMTLQGKVKGDLRSKHNENSNLR